MNEERSGSSTDVNDSLFVELPIPVSARVFLRSEAYRILKDRFQVFVFTPFWDNPEFAREFTDVKLYPSGGWVHPIRRRLHWRIGRRLLDRAATWQLARCRKVETIHLDLQRLKSTKPVGYWIQWVIWRLLGKKAFQSRGWLSSLEKMILKSAWYDALFEMHRPKGVLLTYTGEHTSDWLHRAAIRAGCPVIAHVLNWDNVSSKRYLRHPVNLLLVWNEAMKNLALSYYPQFSKNQVSVIGPLVFDYHGHVKKPALVVRHSESPLVVFFLGPRSMYPGVLADIQAVTDTVREVLPHAKVIVRTHGNDRGTENMVESMANRAFVLDIPTSGFSGAPRDVWDSGDEGERRFLDLITTADIVVTYASTIVLEAAIHDKPVICLWNSPLRGSVDLSDYYRETHFRPIMDHAAFALVRDEEELASALRRYAPPNPALDQSGRKGLVEYVCGPELFSAGRGMASEVLTFLKEH